MKASSVAPPPDNGEWIYEVKFDGFRMLAVKNEGDVDLWSRNAKPLNKRFPEVVNAISRLPLKHGIFDGEVCALDAAGQSSFQLLQNQAETPTAVVYYLFDLLVEGKDDLRSLPLLERKASLEQVMKSASDPLHRSLFFDANPRAILAKMKAVGVEGSIAKLKSSRYESGQRSPNWVKIKFQKSQEFVVAGYTLPKKSRQYFGALILGYYQEKRLVYAGRVGTGFDEKTLRGIFGQLKKLEIEQPQVEEIQEPSGRWRAKRSKPSDVRWVKPKLVAQVDFTGWTDDGVLRHPSFQGLREDKRPREVIREQIMQ